MLTLLALAGAKLQADIKVDAEVLSTNATSSVVRFTFSGDLAGKTPVASLSAFVFLDFSGLLWSGKQHPRM